VSTRATLFAVLLSGCSLCVAAPRPQIPLNELPGHERDRFIDPFPQLPRSEPIIVAPQHAKPALKRKCRDARRSKGSNPRRKC
jgi:hypothetical protein